MLHVSRRPDSGSDTTPYGDILRPWPGNVRSPSAACPPDPITASGGPDAGPGCRLRPVLPWWCRCAAGLVTWRVRAGVVGRRVRFSEVAGRWSWSGGWGWADAPGGPVGPGCCGFGGRVRGGLVGVPGTSRAWMRARRWGSQARCWRWCSRSRDGGRPGSARTAVVLLARDGGWCRRRARAGMSTWRGGIRRSSTTGAGTSDRWCRASQQAGSGRRLPRGVMPMSRAGISSSSTSARQVAAEPVVPGLLPRDVPAFTGREDELARLAGLAGGGSGGGDGDRRDRRGRQDRAGGARRAPAAAASSRTGTCTRTCAATPRARTRPSRVRCWRCSCAASACPPRRCPPTWRSGPGCCGSCWPRGGC